MYIFVHRDIAANMYFYMCIYIYIEFVSARLREIGGDGLQEYGMDTVIFIYIYLYFDIEIYLHI